MTNTPIQGTEALCLRSNLKRGFAASASVLALSLLAQPVAAQTAAEDTIVVTGTRQAIQDAIALKRNNAQVVDGLSADEIGDIPALSIGEALENITGVASHRENGGATEVSIRGLGPFLSSTVVNGRAATNGSGDRSVNFSQFPSELVNKLAVFKTQDATQIEGGVAGQIQIDTIKPLDFGKQRIQFEAKGNVNPDQLNIDDSEAGDFGYRLTGSYTDQFELGAGDVGISIGGQISDISQPEAESRQTGPTSNSRAACLITNGLARFEDDTFGGTFTGFSNNPETEDRGDDDCDDFNDRDNDNSEGQRGSDTEGFDTEIDPNTGVAIDAGTPFAFAPSQRSFRQNDTRDERNAIFGTVQFQPNDRWDVTLDGQWSERTQTEQRNDLLFNGGRRNDTDLNGRGGFDTTLDSLLVSPGGSILRHVTENTIEVAGGNFEREETYTGFGANVEYEVTDRLVVEADYGYSKTERDENNQEFRIQSNITPVIEFNRTEGIVPQFNLFDEDDLDVNDHALFVDRLRVRIDNDVERENTIHSLRFDADYDLGDGFFTGLEAGVRWAEQSYEDSNGGSGFDSGDPFNVNGGRFSFEIEDNFDFTVNNQEVFEHESSDSAFAGVQQQLIDIIGLTNTACATDFAEGNDFLRSEREGDLINVIDANGDVVRSGNSFATFDAQCVAETSVAGINGLLDGLNAAIAGDNDALDGNVSTEGVLALFSSDIPGTQDNLNTIDVTETTTAFYLQTRYEAEIDGVLPISGHIGARLVHTDVDSTGFRQAINISEDEDGGVTLGFAPGLETVSTSSSYTRILPSATAVLEVADDKLVRFGVFRAMSRADPADLGFGRDIDVGSDADDSPITLDQVQNEISASGNPEIDPLMSWNFDAGVEWYPNKDSIFAIGAYYKQFQGGFNNVVQNETFDFDGQEVEVPIDGIIQTSDDTSNLFGVEITAAHGFTYLPGLLSGFGAKISYNYAVSNFEFEDSRYGDVFEEQADGTLLQTNVGIIPPGNLPGLSENVFSGEVYWGKGPLDLSVRYKYRDDYFQPFTSDGTRLRFVNDVGVWEARASYKINNNFRVQAEAINLFSEPRSDSAFVLEDVYQVNDYGPRIFFGVRGRF